MAIRAPDGANKCVIGAKKQCKYGDNVYVDGDAGDGVLRAPVMMIMLMVVKMAMIELVYSGGSKKGVKPDMFHLLV